MTAKEKIIERLTHTAMPLCLFQLKIGGVSETAASARLREMRREGLVVSVPIPGRKYTAWQLAPRHLNLIASPAVDQANDTTAGSFIERPRRHLSNDVPGSRNL